VGQKKRAGGPPPEVVNEFMRRNALHRQQQMQQQGPPPGAVELMDPQLIALATMQNEMREELAELFDKISLGFSKLNLMRDHLRRIAMLQQELAMRTEVQSKEGDVGDPAGLAPVDPPAAADLGVGDAAHPVGMVAAEESGLPDDGPPARPSEGGGQEPELSE